jgi:hypothetical protein
MSLIDHPDKWIIKMFKFNERENVETNAKYYPEGIKLTEIILDDSELVYGYFNSGKKNYYFTSTSLLIKNGKQERIRIDQVTGTNGSFRSEHSVIKIETADGKTYKIKIEEFPYRIQQLFYQLIETHGSIVQKSVFTGPLKLKDIAVDASFQDLTKLGAFVDSKTVIKKVDIKKSNYQIFYQGNINNGIIYPDPEGVLILNISNEYGQIDIFNSKTDGYNGVSESALKSGTFNINNNLKELKINISSLIIEFQYSIEDYEFEDLMLEMNLKFKKEINNLFSSIAIYADKEGVIELLTEFEAQ